MNLNEKQLVNYLLDYSSNIHDKFLKDNQINKFDKYSKILTIASIIEKEAVLKKEQPIISAVIHNRLKKGMKLQMDSTINTGKNTNRYVRAKDLREDNSEFNTYKRVGLPPYPISIVSQDAIKAAINPADVSYLYFVSNDNKSHKFSNTYKEHLSKINKR